MYLRDKAETKIDFSGDEISLEINTDAFKWRVILLYALVAGIFLYLFIGAFQLQIVEGEKELLVANRTNQSQEKILAARGLIFDVNGTKLAGNVASYSLYVDANLLDAANEDKIITSVAEILNVNTKEFLDSFKSKMYNDAGVRSKLSRVTLKSNLNFDQYFAILSRIDDLPGVKLNVETVRNYLNAQTFSNIIGYVGDPTQSDIDNGIYSESQVGKTGVENKYDSYLRGEEGTTTSETDTLTGKEVKNQETEAKSGDNIYLNIDSNWQTYLSNIITNQITSVKAFGGAGVIIKASTGEVKALVTYPSYDNNLFANGISSSDYGTLINDTHKPLFNRPIALQLPPGSTMKIFGAAAALESGTITSETKFLSDRCMDLPGNIKFCEADQSYIGWVNVEQALARSSNIFFCKAMQAMHDKPGYNYYYDIAASFGIGNKTGIDLPGESSGTLPSASYKKLLTGESWYIGDECNTVIGQGYATVTPLQMAVAVSAIINGGNIMEPHVLNKIVGQDGTTVYTQEPKKISNVGLSDKTLKIIEDGMRLGVTEGTSSTLKSLPGYIISKTGSSDAGEWINGKYYTGAHSWVAGCFEYEGEMYCYTVMQQWGGRGYKTVPIMKKFINCVYNNFTDKCEDIQ